MNIREAALDLHKKLQYEPWLRMVGIGADEIVIYVANRKLANERIPNTYEGYIVRIEKVGKIRPLYNNI